MDVTEGDRGRHEHEQQEREEEPDRGWRREGENESERNRESGGRGAGRSTGLGDGVPGGLRLESSVITNLETALPRSLERDNVASSDSSPGFFPNSKDLVVNDDVFNGVQRDQMNTNSGE